MSPFPTPCKGKSKSQPFAPTFALTGRKRLYADTQGVALGCELAALSGRSFSRFVRLSCAHASPLVVWQKNAQRFFWILNTLPNRGSYLGEGFAPTSWGRLMNLAPVRGSYLESYCEASPANDMRPLQGQKLESMSCGRR